MGRDNNTSKNVGNERQLIRDLAELLDETGLSEIEIERSGLKVRVARTMIMSAVAPASAGHSAGHERTTELADDATSSGSPADAASHPGAIKSPMVGTVYLATEPGATQFVDVGTTVAEGQTLLIIEAMKTMNHIPASKSGTVKQILVMDAQPVEFGEPLMIIE